MAEEIPAYKLMYLDQVYLLTTYDREKKRQHVIPQLWTMPVSFKPQLLAVAVAKARYTHHIIEETNEFVLNICSSEMAASVWACAPPAGDSCCKFDRAKLTPIKASKVKAPLIKECIGAIECKVIGKLDSGDHTIFVAEVLATHQFKKGKVLVNAPGEHKFEV